MSKFDSHNRLEKKYSPDQERDELGRFGSGSGALRGSSTDSVSRGIATRLAKANKSLATERARMKAILPKKEFNAPKLKQTGGEPKGPVGYNVHGSLKKYS